MKNFSVYKVDKGFFEANRDIEALNETLKGFELQPIQSSQLESVGFISASSHTESFIEPVGDNLLVGRVGIEEKKTNNNAINKILTKQIALIEKQEGRKVTRKERTGMKDEIIFEMTPNIYPTETFYQFYFDTKREWLVINANTDKQCDCVIDTLRQAFGSLPVVPIQAKAPQFMSAWATGNTPKNINFNEDEKISVKSMTDQGVGGNMTACLATEDIYNVSMVKKAGFIVKDSCFTLDDKLRVSKFGITDLDRLDSLTEIEDEAQYWQSTFFLYSSVFAESMDAILAEVA